MNSGEGELLTKNDQIIVYYMTYLQIIYIVINVNSEYWFNQNCDITCLGEWGGGRGHSYMKAHPLSSIIGSQ